MSLITLISDWNNHDFYVGAVKGKVLSMLPHAQVIDISHKIHNFDISHAAYVLKNSFFHFPKNTIHIVCVENRSFSNKYIAVEADGHYFLSADTGIFGLVFDNDLPYKCYSIEVNENFEYPTFPTLSVLVPAAYHLANGGCIEELGKKIDDENRQVPLMAVYERDIISGKIIFIDSYGNVVTNISKELFYRIGKNRNFKITVKNKHNVITTISKTYYDMSVGDLLALFNSANLLEIAAVNANAAEAFSLDTDTYIRVLFIDK